MSWLPLPYPSFPQWSNWTQWLTHLPHPGDPRRQEWNVGTQCFSLGLCRRDYLLPSPPKWTTGVSELNWIKEDGNRGGRRGKGVGGTTDRRRREGNRVKYDPVQEERLLFSLNRQDVDDQKFEDPDDRDGIKIKSVGKSFQHNEKRGGVKTPDSRWKTKRLYKCLINLYS